MIIAAREVGETEHMECYKYLVQCTGTISTHQGEKQEVRSV